MNAGRCRRNPGTYRFNDLKKRLGLKRNDFYTWLESAGEVRYGTCRDCDGPVVVSTRQQLGNLLRSPLEQSRCDDCKKEVQREIEEAEEERANAAQERLREAIATECKPPGKIEPSALSIQHLVRLAAWAKAIEDRNGVEALTQNTAPSLNDLFDGSVFYDSPDDLFPRADQVFREMRRAGIIAVDPNSDEDYFWFSDERLMHSETGVSWIFARTAQGQPIHAAALSLLTDEGFAGRNRAALSVEWAEMAQHETTRRVAALLGATDSDERKLIARVIRDYGRALPPLEIIRQGRLAARDLGEQLLRNGDFNEEEASHAEAFCKHLKRRLNRRSRKPAGPEKPHADFGCYLTNVLCETFFQPRQYKAESSLTGMSQPSS